jgi:chorismate mutase
MPAHAPRRRLLAGPLLVCALAVLAALAPTAGPAVRTVGDSTADSGVDPLLDLIVTRIETGDVVARAKWASRGPVEDPAREQVVLDAARAGATGRGLDPDVVAAVFADQIAASMVVQYGLFSDWTAEPAAAPAPGTDLATVRPVLDRITTGLLDQLAATADRRGGAACGRTVQDAARHAAVRAGFDELHRAALARAVRSLCT